MTKLEYAEWSETQDINAVYYMRIYNCLNSDNNFKQESSGMDGTQWVSRYTSDKDKIRVWHDTTDSLTTGLHIYSLDLEKANQIRDRILQKAGLATKIQPKPL